jgi:hypothetical protein
MASWNRNFYLGKALFPNDWILLDNLQHHASDEATDYVIENWYRQFFVLRPRQAMDRTLHRLWMFGYVLIRPTEFDQAGLIKHFSVSLTVRGEQAARAGKYV